jgi:hypothetical protein
MDYWINGLLGWCTSIARFNNHYFWASNGSMDLNNDPSYCSKAKAHNNSSNTLYSISAYLLQLASCSTDMKTEVQPTVSSTLDKHITKSNRKYERSKRMLSISSVSRCSAPSFFLSQKPTASRLLTVHSSSTREPNSNQNPGQRINYSGVKLEESVDSKSGKSRLDSWISSRISGISRARVQSSIKSGLVSVNGKVIDKVVFSTLPRWSLLGWFSGMLMLLFV